MTPRSIIAKVTQQEDLNFLLTNRLPRRWLTLFTGWLSRIEQPLVRACALPVARVLRC
jgi:phosphatidylserine decarboxylase